MSDDDDTDEGDACILGMWCMLIKMFVLLVQLHYFVKIPSGVTYNYVSVYPAEPCLSD